jgi:23S rRNA pseudouridine1911/1915/1917 synthase
MRRIFEKEEIEKTYYAFLRGRLKKRTGFIKAEIQDNYQKKFARNSRAKLAVTSYEVTNYHKGFTVVKVMPKTGRTNQIRIHFSGTGYPLLGERVYAFRKDFSVDMNRLALHCYSLRFKNPVTREKVYAVSDFPKDMAAFLSKNS